MTRSVHIAACAYPIERPATLEAYLDKQARSIEDAVARGAELLVMPEYASLELAGLMADAHRTSAQAELRFVQPLLPTLLDAYDTLAKQNAVYVLGPSFPELDSDGGFRNRARLHSPSGAHVAFEKQQMTRFEREDWDVQAGSTCRVIETELGVLGVAICYDSEFPLLVRRQVEQGAEIVLVPSCTDTLAGYHRVALSCRARALENQCFVVMAPTVGEARWSQALDVNRGAAAIYGPIDRGFASDGVIAEGDLDAPGWITACVDLDALAEVRADGQVRNHRDWSLPAHLDGQVERLRLR
jgi:predicted amidohydrolase